MATSPYDVQGTHERPEPETSDEGTHAVAPARAALDRARAEHAAEVAGGSE